MLQFLIYVGFKLTSVILIAQTISTSTQNQEYYFYCSCLVTIPQKS